MSDSVRIWGRFWVSMPRDPGSWQADDTRKCRAERKRMPPPTKTVTCRHMKDGQEIQGRQLVTGSTPPTLPSCPPCALSASGGDRGKRSGARRAAEQAARSAWCSACGGQCAGVRDLCVQAAIRHRPRAQRTPARRDGETMECTRRQTPTRPRRSEHCGCRCVRSLLMCVNMAG